MILNKTVNVKNIHSGSRPAPSGYSSWLSYWMKEQGVTSTPKCANIACTAWAEHGGHVKKVKSNDNSWYIVPLCVECNEDKDKEFIVYESNLVPVNKA